TARSDKLVQYYLPPSDARALDWVDRKAPAGGVLAPTPFAAVVPSQTGRAVWVGHGYWSRDYPVQSREVDRLFGGRLAAAPARARRPPPGRWRPPSRVWARPARDRPTALAPPCTRAAASPEPCA